MAQQRTNATGTDEAAAQVRAGFRERYGDAESVRLAKAPGRVNLMGDHTDYNDGFVLPMTIHRATYVALRRRADQTVRLRSLNVDDEITYALPECPSVEAGAWTSYVTGVVEELRKRDLLPAGFEGVLYGDVPLGAGLSSSASLEVAVAVGLQALFGFALDPADVAKLCQHVEHAYAGVQCGIMDQFAARIGQAGHALFLDCRTLAYQHVPLALEEARLVIVDSGVSRGLADSKYNERRAECEEAVETLQRSDEAITALRDVTPELLEAHQEALPEPVRQRAWHVVSENARVRQGAEALRRGDLNAFGERMYASHASLRDRYEVSVPELDTLVELARQTPGVFGARMTGAGFGGCMVSLVHRDAAEELEARIRRHYPEAHGQEPALYRLEQNLEAGPLDR